MRYALLMVGTLLLVPDMTAWAGDKDAKALSPSSGRDARTTGLQWLSQDLHLTAGELLSHEPDTGGQLLVCRGGFSMALAGRQWSSRDAVVWIRTERIAKPGGPARRYDVQVYLEAEVSHEETGNAQTLEVKEVAIGKGKAVVVRASVSGDVFITAAAKRTGSPYSLALYADAASGFGKAGLEVPAGPEPAAASRTTPGARKGASASEKPTYYTVGVSSLSETPANVESSQAGDTQIITWIGRAYIFWQEQAEGAAPSEAIELQADTLVLWRKTADTEQASADLSATQFEGVAEVYVAGDVLLRQGQRTIRATELYYDLRNKRGLARNAVLRSFDPIRDVPVYVRAKELRQLGESRFEADDICLTTSEFWTPQISARASKVSIIDTIKDADAEGETRDSDYVAYMKDVRFKYYNTTLLRLPSMRSNLLSPSVPLKSVHVGRDSAFGASVETQWFLGRVLGLQEPPGTDSTLFLDYYDKRGPGGGAAVDYERENYFGHVLGYVIDDHGEDRLGRTRKNVEVPNELRGRFGLQHRQFLPDNWQLTAEVSYLSDKNFLEQFYRQEFFAGKEQETLLHAKRIEDNRALALLGKMRINDFQDEMEELPSAEYHWTGQSFLDDRFVFFSDSQASRLRYRFGEGRSGEPEEFFTFAQTRNEVDMPLALGTAKVVPFVAGTFGFDDGAGFQKELDEPGFEAEGKDAVGIGEAGVRMSTLPFWRVYRQVESELWDVHGLRHTIRPSLTAVAYTATNETAAQRNTLDLGVSQKWQTKRGPLDSRRTVNWLELDVDFVWVSDSSDEVAGPDRFLWNQPFIPLINRAGGQVPPFDRRVTDLFGPQRNYTSAAATWRVSETMSVLGDAYLDMQEGTVEQVDMGFSRLAWPNLSYFIGSRYLRDVDNGLGQHGSNAATFALTYVLDPRYTLVLAEQYDFDYGANIRTDLTLIRKYHRVNFAVTVSVDESLDEQRVVFSLWPEGVPELAIGLRRYVGLGASEALY
jgi:hypothetical protein